MMDSMQPEQRLQAIVNQLMPSAMVSSAACEELARRPGDCSVTVANTAQQTRLYQLRHHPQTRTMTCQKFGRPICCMWYSDLAARAGQKVPPPRTQTCALQHQQDILGINAISRVYVFSSYTFDGAWFMYRKGRQSEHMGCGPDRPWPAGGGGMFGRVGA